MLLSDRATQEETFNSMKTDAFITSNVLRRFINQRSKVHEMRGSEGTKLVREKNKFNASLREVNNDFVKQIF